MDILRPREVQDYRSVYHDIKAWVPQLIDIDSGHKVDWEDVVFEVELLKSQEINLDYILELIFDANQKLSDKNQVIDEVTRVIRSSLGQRAKESLLVDFISTSDLDQFTDKADILEHFYAFARKKQAQAVTELIQKENLHPENAKRYIKASLKNNYASENGSALNDLLPRMSPLNPQYRTKKQAVYQQITELVETFSGVGGDF